MRLGSNPAKASPQLRGYGLHRVIIPVYIPNMEGYFEHSLEVLKVCLASLRLTTQGKANVTIISNGSAPEIEAEIRRQFDLGWIDQVLLNQVNRGKVDAIMSVARGAFETFVTVSDSDVLFNTGWLEAVEDVFAAFPEAGVVAPNPAPHLAWRYTSATVLGAFLSRELRLKRVVPASDLDRFAESIGWDVFGPANRDRQVVVQRGNHVACVGAGHFVFTMRKGVVRGAPRNPSMVAMGASSEAEWLDEPPDAMGLWRLATPKAYAHHMGNVVAPWVHGELDRCTSPGSISHPKMQDIRLPWVSRVPYRMRRAAARIIHKTLDASRKENVRNSRIANTAYTKRIKRDSSR